MENLSCFHILHYALREAKRQEQKYAQTMPVAELWLCKDKCDAGISLK